MESVTSHGSRLRILRCQAAALASAGQSLAALLDSEASRLKRKDEASRLTALHSAVRQQMDRARSMEAAASCGHSEARLLTSLGGLLLGGAIKLASRDKRLLAISDSLLKNVGSEDRPFGTVMVCVGPKGVPDDVAALSISRLARESSRAEAEVIHDIRRRGCLLLTERDFSRLIEKLADGVLQGQLALPVSTEKLSQVETTGSTQLAAKQPRWVRVRRPQ